MSETLSIIAVALSILYIAILFLVTSGYKTGQTPKAATDKKLKQAYHYNAARNRSDVENTGDCDYE